MRQNLSRYLILILLVVGVTGCGVNPVTGKREISFVSTAQQIQLGEQNYAPSQQAQGGQYELDDSLNRYIAGVGQKLAAVSDVPELPYEFVVLDNGVPNAWALPGGKIAINRGLLVELEDESQLAAVLGHEIVHAAAAHGAAQITRSSLLGGVGTAIGFLGRNSDYAGLINTGTQLGSSGLLAKYGRDDELESDRYGIIYMKRAGYDPQGAVELQETFVRLSGNRRSDFISGLFASHPPSQRRVEENKALVNEIGAGGFRGREEYQDAIAQMTRDEPAYAAEAEAIKALQANNPSAALKALDRAVAIQPDEGQFWELRGHAWRQQGNLNNAEKAFSTAISKNPNYFQHWLARGMLRKERGNHDQARRDLLESEKYLSTATTSLALGEISESKGDIQNALGYYQKAASAGGEAGSAARSKMTRIDLPRNPGNYLPVRAGLTQEGKLAVLIQNSTNQDVHDVQIRVTETVAGTSKTIRVRNSIQAGSQRTLTIGDAAEGGQYRAEVIAAKIK